MKGRCKSNTLTSSLLLLSIFLCFNLSVLAAKDYTVDSIHKKYPLNDPRNPNCPCHSYQKKSEKEYKKIKTEHSDKTIQFNYIEQNRSTLKKTSISQYRTYLSNLGRSKHKKYSSSKRRKHKLFNYFIYDKLSNCPKW